MTTARLLLVLVLGAGVFLVLGTARASAYSAPAGLPSSTASGCRTRPLNSGNETDPLALQARAVSATGGQDIVSATAPVGAGFADIYAAGSAGGSVFVEEQNTSTSAWETVAQEPIAQTTPGSSTGVTQGATELIYLPGGNTRLELVNGPNASTDYYSLSLTQPDSGQADAAQAAADTCEIAAQSTAQAHSDEQTVEGDINQLDSDVKAQGSADAPSSTVSVSNFPADQQVSLDAAASGQEDEDSHAIYAGLWVVVGTILGCFVMGQALDRLWPGS